MAAPKGVTYSKKLTTEICLRMSKGESVSSICLDDHMPTKGAVTQWKDKYGDFAKQYALAHEAREDRLFTEMLDIADDARNDWMKRHGQEDEDYWVLNGEHVQRSRLRIDTRKWQLSKMNPNIYGDRTINDNNNFNTEIPIDQLSEDQLTRIAKQKAK